MDITTLFIALALAMDSFSVAIANGLANKTFKTTKALKISAFFGFFQAIMPIIGWYAGAYILDLISSFDHWVAFFLLTFIGSKMIYESIKNGPDKLANSLSIKGLLILFIRKYSYRFGFLTSNGSKNYLTSSLHRLWAGVIPLRSA